MSHKYKCMDLIQILVSGPCYLLITLIDKFVH